MKFHIAITMGVGMTQHGIGLNKDEVDRALAVIKHQACELAGGYTLARTEGGWMDQGRVIEEEGVRMDVLVDDVRGEPLEIARKLATVARSELDQQCVLVEVWEVVSYFV